MKPTRGSFRLEKEDEEKFWLQQVWYFVFILILICAPVACDAISIAGNGGNLQYRSKVSYHPRARR